VAKAKSSENPQFARKMDALIRVAQRSVYAIRAGVVWEANIQGKAAIAKRCVLLKLDRQQIGIHLAYQKADGVLHGNSRCQHGMASSKFAWTDHLPCGHGCRSSYGDPVHPGMGAAEYAGEHSRPLSEAS
jgi:hypothetical protein